MSNRNRSKWKLKKECQVNPFSIKRLNTYFVLTIQPKFYNENLNLSGHIRKFINRLKVGLKKGVRYKMINKRTGKVKKGKCVYKKKLLYIWTVELGEKTNRMHVNFLINYPFIPISYILKIWGIGTQNKIEQIKSKKKKISNAKILKYITKYVCKEEHANYDLCPVKTKRYIGKSISFPFQFCSSYEIEKNLGVPVQYDDDSDVVLDYIKSNKYPKPSLRRKLKLSLRYYITIFYHINEKINRCKITKKNGTTVKYKHVRAEITETLKETIEWLNKHYYNTKASRKEKQWWIKKFIIESKLKFDKRYIEHDILSSNQTIRNRKESKLTQKYKKYCKKNNISIK